ncbi:ATP-binding cassette sub-family C member 10 [Dermochelys coriacea]|uniref:ATP-binding cassette sub-family C member 10 n=1 Tax=Dermochelys coriacea TaxID=27794 RepID=UPI0018E898F2|nr:ATP-binding cassette sub-family C member 10 [Dermochelys coriacea]XP_038251341.1 ATP-binding cassette sub-family C member 10 [Dermochelys coriacea]XP_038251342.1 ATP-binding cassette sub-family C member 10 [Dermochelys coriacea]XP_038251343.1 ATP-binding cassette sub-family C member 10 [Dermochelys coriacea]XP_043367481.1 ATP-binding cassette sub-family C member 10 [Dermochelys coriacea]
MEQILADLCGTRPEDPLPVWVHGSVGHCFNQLILNVVPHAILALVSACYLGTPRSPDSGASHRPGWKCRIAASFVLTVLPILDIISAAITQKELGTLYLVVLASGIALLAWLTHSLGLLMLYRSTYGSSRGPAAMVLLALFPVPALIITLVWYCQNGVAWPHLHAAHICRLSILCLQLVSLLIYVIGYITPVASRQVFCSINDSWQREPLITESGIPAHNWQGVAEDGESWLSRFSYAWMNPLMKRGYQWILNRPQDVYLLPRRLQAARVHDHFYSCWQEKAALIQEEQDTMSSTSPIVTKSDGSGDISPSSGSRCDAQQAVQLLSVLHAAFGLRYYSLGLLKLAGSLLGFSGPLLLNLLVGFMESHQEPLSHGMLYALGLFASSFLGALLRNQFSYEVNKVMLMVRAAVISAIYRKAVRVSGSSLSGFTMGEIVNFMSTDTDRLVNFCVSFHEVWSLPFQFAITLYLLYQQVGVAFLGGLALALLLLPVNKVIANRIMENNKEMLKHKDTRVKLMTEFLCGMRVIKFYTWEQHFGARINACRAKELKKLRAIKYLDAVCVYLWAALPVVVSIVIFITYVLLGHQLTATKVFTALALVGMLILPLNNFPWVLNGILDAKVSLDRIQCFLELSDQDLHAYYTTDGPTDPSSALEMHHSTFSWSPTREESTKQHLSRGTLQIFIQDLAVAKGALVGVVGKVGCGKSSLLAAITGELNRLGGQVYVWDLERGFGLATQEPWIQFTTVRENILFGRDYDARLYHEVLEGCALSDDLNILPAGDQTEVGENGVTLSGGQKARIALARAVYQEKEIYLLDDPLAAVDADVANHLMQKCILGVLKHKTRILCTHRTEFLEKADTLLLMDNGRIVKIGTPSEILPLVEATPKVNENKRRQNKVPAEQGQEEDMEIEAEELGQANCLLQQEEEKKEGAVAFQVYRAYWLAVGSCLALSILFSLLLMQASGNVSVWWLSHWISSLPQTANISTRPLSASVPSPQLLLFSLVGLVSRIQVLGTAPVHPNSTLDVNFYLMVYGGIAGANSVFTILRAFLFAYGTIRAATVIHSRLFQRVMKATVTFFDITPTGRILNRFSSDLYCVDDSLPFILNIFLANVFGLLGMLVMITYGLPWIGLILLPLAALYFSIQRYYRRTSRELKRLYSLTLSPIYTHFSETLTGLSTIRATRATDRFEAENQLRLEQNQRCLFASNTAMQWLDIRLQMIGVAVVTAIAGIAIIQHQRQLGNPGLVGLALSYALSVTNLLSGLISSFTQTETMMVSVERAEEYSTDIPIEPQEQLVQVAPDWPSQGHVEFQQVVLTYRPGLPNALDGVTFTIYPGEKVGIVGRTGSGKSTIFLALFRMVELSGGRILLDNVDSRSVGLESLRSKLAIIPQDPFLFSGTIRENLDPLGRHTDFDLYQVLEQCHLQTVITQMGGLDSELGERGKSLSVGQRQLVCLARALLTQAKVLCIDEATASVDQKTDQLLQQTIRQRFADKTVLMIAHRLNTILDSDRVLVLHAGKVAELDSPAVLSKREDSLFQQLLTSGQQ